MGPINSKITLTKEKERRKRKRARRKKGGEEKKAMVALLVFIMATLETSGKKNCWTEKDPFGRNVFKNPARHKMKKKKSIQCLNLSIQN